MAAPWSLDGGGAGLSPWCRERRTTTAASDLGLLTAEDLLRPRFPGRQIRELPYIFLVFFFLSPLGCGEPKARGCGDEAAEGVQELSAAAAAVLAEQNWWKLLDFTLLKRSSVSFNIEKQETAVFKWLRVRAPAAKFEKGLSKDSSKR
ncbi:hypothetical protein ACQ4PT_032131 [Festuca glaucescens]